MRTLNVKSMKKSFDNGMPIEEIVLKINQGLKGTSLIKVLDKYYEELERNENNKN